MDTVLLPVSVFRTAVLADSLGRGGSWKLAFGNIALLTNFTLLQPLAKPGSGQQQSLSSGSYKAVHLTPIKRSVNRMIFSNGLTETTRR